MKLCKDLQKYVKPVGSSSGPWPQNMVASLDRTLGEISRILDKQVNLLRMTVFLRCVVSAVNW